MTPLLSLLDRALPVLQPCLIGVAIGCWGIGFVRAIRNRRGLPPYVDWADPTYSVALTIFAGIIAFEFGLASLYGREARNEIAAFCAGGVESVSINGSPSARADELVALLAAPRQPWGHHSHPTRELRMRLTGPKGTLELALGRDSGDPHEYWVSYPRYSVTSHGDIGHVFTDQLDSF